MLAVALLDLLRVFDARARLGRVAGFVVLLALPLAALTGTPLPLVIAAPMVVAVAAYAISGFGKKGRRRALAAGAASAAVVALAIEVPWFVGHRASERPGRIVVVGDSLSSGGFGEEAPWPELLRNYGVETVNVSRPSETLATVPLDVVREELARGGIAIVAAGGNDLLEQSDVRLFARDLETIVTASRQAGADEVWMLELPLPPGTWGYGGAQRRIAREHGVHLVPKRVLLRVLARDDMTDDGLHPTSAGHELLARAIGRRLRLSR